MIVNNELGMIGKKRVWPNLRYYPGYYKDRLREIRVVAVPAKILNIYVQSSK
jgi:hypothetical protein